MEIPLFFVMDKYKDQLNSAISLFAWSNIAYADREICGLLEDWYKDDTDSTDIAFLAIPKFTDHHTNTINEEQRVDSWQIKDLWVDNKWYPCNIRNRILSFDMTDEWRRPRGTYDNLKRQVFGDNPPPSVIDIQDEIAQESIKKLVGVT